MIRKVVAAFLVVVGVSLVVFCLVLQNQFKDLVADPEPKPGKYVVLDSIIQGSPAYTNKDPAELARSVSRRIFFIGAGGIALVLMSMVIFLAGARRTARAGGG